MKNCVVKNCKNSAVYLNSSSWLPLRFTIDHCRFEGNQAKEGGGAFFCKCVNDTNTITNCEFINNASYHSCGGALNVGMAVVKNCEFRGNRSEFRFNNLSKGAGGAIYAEHLTCIDSRFYDNKTNDQAGAIMLRQVDLNRNIFKNRVEISGCTFSGNYAPNVGGAIRIWAAGTRADQFIKNNTFSGNYSKKGKAVFIEKATKAYQDVLFSTNHGTDCGYNGLVVLTELK
jgi:predicted outer membrane repeat protein